jgi:signal transduction histidine kinase
MNISNPRANAVDSIETAIAHLADALGELDRMPTGDRSALGVAAHALNNCVSVGDATIDLLTGALRDHPNPEVATWLHGLHHLGDLMHHTISRLVNASTPADFPLMLESIDLPPLMSRACDYHRPSAEAKQLKVECTTVGEIPRAWGDRVAIAVVADNLLSSAIKYSQPAGSVVVQVLPGPGGVVCRVRDHQQAQVAVVHSDARPTATPVTEDPSYRYAFSIVKELVQRMGGRVWYESDSQKGTCFAFSLPYPPAGERVEK